LIINILNQDILPIPKTYSEDMKNLVSLLLKKDPNLRPSIEEIFELSYIKERINKFQLELGRSNIINSTNSNNFNNPVTINSYSKNNNYGKSNSNLNLNNNSTNLITNFTNSNLNSNSTITTVSTSNNTNYLNNQNYTNYLNNTPNSNNSAKSYINTNPTRHLENLTNTNNQSTIYNNHSPINDYASSLLNFGFGNLMREIEEIHQEKTNRYNGIITGNTNLIIRNNSFIKNKSNQNNPKNLTEIITSPLVKDKKHHKYSPSYAVKDIQEIMKHMNIPMSSSNQSNKSLTPFNEDFSREDSLITNSNGKDSVKNLSKFSKNQFSVPEFHNVNNPLLKDSSSDKLSTEQSKF